jgi:hypothetical protein
MKRFESSFDEIDKVGDAYLVIGRNDGDEPIAVGDSLNDWEVRRIEAYGHDLTELSPGMGARLTLVHRTRGTDHFPILLTGYRSPF